MSNPFITAICPTRGRREWLPKAIACFLAQDYEPKELIIVGDELSDFEGLLPNDPRVKAAVAPSKMTIGEKRNLCCYLAQHADLIAHWDDDDHSEPGRIEDQVARLEESGKAVTGYRCMKFTDGARWWLYSGAYPLGTSLMYTRAWWESHPFPHVPCGEDVAFAQEAMAAREMAVADDLGLMYATIHAGIPTAGWNLRNGCECPVCLSGGDTKSATANTSHRQITPGSTWELIPSAEAMYNRFLVTA